MARGKKLEDQLAALHALARGAIDDAAKAELRKALAGASNHVAAKAAAIVGEHAMTGLADDLAAAFARFLTDGADKGCTAKTAIAEALDRLEADALDVYLPGVRHVQMEPVFGGSADAAAELRSRCALALVRMGYPDALTELAELLADADAGCRATAAQALGHTGSPAAAPLLRFKAKLGDEEPRVVSEAMTALLQLSGRHALPFIEQFLGADDDDTAQAAAVALGQSRLPEAFAVLRREYESTFDADRKRTLLLAIAMLRHDEPLTFLIDLIDESSRAVEAIAALAMYRHDESLKERIKAAVARRDEASVTRAFGEHFGVN